MHVVDTGSHFLHRALVIVGHLLGIVVEGHPFEHVFRFVDRREDRVERLVQVAHDHAVCSPVTRGVQAHLGLSFDDRLGQRIHVARQLVQARHRSVEAFCHPAFLGSFVRLRFQVAIGDLVDDPVELSRVLVQGRKGSAQVSYHVVLLVHRRGRFEVSGGDVGRSGAQFFEPPVHFLLHDSKRVHADESNNCQRCHGYGEHHAGRCEQRAQHFCGRDSHQRDKRDDQAVRNAGLVPMLHQVTSLTLSLSLVKERIP